MDVARRGQRQIEQAEAQIGSGQAQHEGGGGVRSQFAALYQSGDRQRVACVPFITRKLIISQPQIDIGSIRKYNIPIYRAKGQRFK